MAKKEMSVNARAVGILVADGLNGATINLIRKAAIEAGANVKIIALKIAGVNIKALKLK